MIRSFFSFLLIFFVGFTSNFLFASLPDEHNILIEVNETNESSYLKLIAEKLVEIYNCNFDEIAETTTENAKIIFKLD